MPDCVLSGERVAERTFPTPMIRKRRRERRRERKRERERGMKATRKLGISAILIAKESRKNSHAFHGPYFKAHKRCSNKLPIVVF